MARNDCLQVLVETRIVVFSLVPVPHRLEKLTPSSRSWRNALQLSAVVGCTGLLVTALAISICKFPGNAGLFLCFLRPAYELLSTLLPVNVDGGRFAQTRLHCKCRERIHQPGISGDDGLRNCLQLNIMCTL
jgi:hypothetical protein